jgi:hypothetical protein
MPSCRTTKQGGSLTYFFVPREGEKQSINNDGARYHEERDR